VALFLATTVTCCFDSDGGQEFVAPNVTAKHLQDIEKRTGIDLPDGSVGMALFDGSGRDPSMWAKINIPSDKVDALRASKPFQGARPGASTLVSGFDRPWWNPDQLTDASTGSISLSGALVDWTLGQEGKKHMLYIRWDTF